ncbi:MAG: NGG1p interacting factor NIF3 [Candidatus Omnitrophota bacterium]
MKLKKLYELIISCGIDADPRGPDAVRCDLKKTKELYEAASAGEKTYFDKDRLWNPYDDSRLLHGRPEKDIKTLMAGIDIDTSELLLIERLNDSPKKQKIDLALSHHPQGCAFAGLSEVMDMQADIYHTLGVPVNVAEGLVADRQKEISRRIHGANHHRASSAARLLDIPFMCAHSPADNHAVSYLQGLLERKKPGTVKEIMDILLGIEEYRESARGNTPPTLLFGRPQNRVGKIFVDMTGGTEGPKDIVDALVSAGVGTIIGMHASEELFKKLQGKNINVIIAGHISSDSLGMNLLLDKIERDASVTIRACSGFTRVKR